MTLQPAPLPTGASNDLLDQLLKYLVPFSGPNGETMTAIAVLPLNTSGTQPAVGQQLSTASTPVVIASDQSGIPIQSAPGQILLTNARLQDGVSGAPIRGVTINGGGVYQIQSNINESGSYLNVASALMNLGANGGTQTYPDYQCNNVKALLVDFNVTASAGTTPALQILIDRKGLDGIYYNIYASAASGATAATSADVGFGASGANKGLGSVIRARAIITGTATPTVTFSMSVQAIS